MSNAKELFLFHRNELLKSLEDGFDLDRNAAEFMMAYSNLDNEPSDSLSLMCKSASQKLLILRKENDEEGEVAETSAAESASSGSKSAMYLYGLKGLGSTPSKHPWIDKVVGTKNHHFRHAVWPFVEKDSKAHYKGVTPFDEDFYPLLRKNAVTGRRQFSELLRSMFIGGENEPLSKKHAKSELDWENHYLKSKNPLILGENKLYTGMGDDNKKNYNFGGRISLNGTTHKTNHDLYERDFLRWKLDNGFSKIDDDEKMRKDHFNNRADGWEGDDTVFHEGEEIPQGLGWLGYMMGMEWLKPEERSAVLKHLEDKGSVHEDHQKITLPNGDTLPAARFAYNTMERMTPEMNWWMRSQSVHTPNTHHRRESNEKDFKHGVNRFQQAGLNHLAHFPYDDDNESSPSVTEMILEQINQHPSKSEGDEINHLPRFKKHLNTKIPQNETWDSLKEAEKNHYIRPGEVTPHQVALSAEDLYYLSGYHPETKEHLPEHPIYGKLENPIIPKEKIEELIEDAKKYSGQAAVGKNVRNALAHKKNRFGPKPEDNKLDFWNEHEDGFTTGNGSHWWQPFAETGGVGRNSSTYLEFIHSMLADKNGDSILGSLDDGGNLHLNKNTNNIFGHFSPYIAPHDIELKFGKDGKAFFGKTPTMLPSDYHINPHDISLARHDSNGALLPLGEGKTFKNNVTDHLSSVSGKYTNFALGLSTSERREMLEGGSLGHHLSYDAFTENPFGYQSRAYGEGASDKVSQKQSVNSHILATVLGRLQPFEEPQKKLVHTLNSLKSSGAPFSTGSNLDEWLDFVGWSPTISASPDNISLRELISTPEELDAYRGLSIAVKHLDTRNPHLIAEYLNEGDFTGLDATEQQFLGEAVQKLGNITAEDIGGISSSAVASKLGEGAFQPPLPQELELRNELEKLENSMEEEIATGNMDSEEISSYRNQIQEVQSKLADQQKLARNKQPRESKSNWWKERSKTMLTKLEADNNAIAEAAKLLKPMVEEQQPDAFDPSNKMKFLHNSAQLMRMANRWLLTSPHEAHNQTTYNYGVSHKVKDTLESLVGQNHHADIANYLNEHGEMIDGNMSVGEVLETLNMTNTPNHKAHARQAINQSNQMNTPLKVMSLHNAITSGNRDDLGGIDITPFHEEDYHGLLEEGQKETKGEISAWKSHALHSVPRQIVRMLSQQNFGKGMQEHGLGMIKNNVYDIKGKGVGPFKKKTRQTQNMLDSILTFNPEVATEEGVKEVPIEEEVSAVSDWTHGRPISAPHPEGYSIFDLYDSGRMDWGYEASPTFGIEFDGKGQPSVGNNVDNTLLHSVSEEALGMIHGQTVTNQALALPGITPNQPNQLQLSGTGEVPADDSYSVATAEINDYIQSLLNPDVLLMKATKDDWSPPIRPMHRIFELKDIKHLRGFSDSWVVSKWYDGKRIIVVKDEDDVLFLNENGKKAGVPKSVKENVVKLSDKDFTIDTILQKNELYVMDILNYDGTDVADMDTNERLKILRGQLESHENVFIPGPYNTRVTDEEGLEGAVNELKEDSSKILLRDSKSTYMKGERRHPKWLILREEKELNFIILDRRGEGPYTYRIGAGPILSAEGLGNRAVEIKGKPYMDVGTVNRVEKPFKEGDIVNAKIASVTRKTRGGRDIFNVQVNSIEGEGGGEGAASSESLSLLTKSLPPIIRTHDLDFNGEILKIEIEGVDTIRYTVESFDNNWYLSHPLCEMGDLTKSDYSYKLSESLKPFWSPVASLLLNGLLKMEDSDEEDDEEVESAGILNDNDENRILKPEMVKAMKIALRALDLISKEKMTWTGPKGLGFDIGTPDESPRGPTSLRDDSTLPDYDMRARPGEDPEKPMTANKKGKHKLVHAKLQTDEGESVGFDFENDDPVLSID